jgi:hypothetical protein
MLIGLAIGYTKRRRLQDVGAVDLRVAAVERARGKEERARR